MTGLAHATSRERECGARLLLCLAVAGSVLAIGSVDTTVLLIVSAVLTAAFSLARSQAPLVPMRRPALIIAIVTVALTGFTALQAVPLPRSLVARLSPHSADVWSRCLKPLHEPGPWWVTLSLDPVATRIQVLVGFSYLMAFLASWLVSSKGRSGERLLVRTMILTSGAVALLAVVHYVLRLDRVYGFYQPHTGVTNIAPLMNGNHLAAYTNVGILLAFASLLSGDPVFPRALLVATVLLLGGAEFWFSSRGGVGSMLAGMLVIVIPRIRSLRTAEISAAFVVAFAGIVLLVVAANSHLMTEYLDTDFSKLEIPLRVFKRMVPAFPWFGAGRGAFESTFPEFNNRPGYLVWTHPENLPAEWVSEWGIPVAIGAIVALVVALRPATVLSRTRPPIGPWACIVALVLHNLVDFSLDIPAVGITAAVCAALATSSRGTRSPPRRTVASGWWRGRTGIVAAISAWCMLLCVLGGNRHELQTDRATMQEQLRSKTFLGNLRLAMASHPAEPYFPYLGAVWASSAGRTIVPWIDRTLERAPVYPMAHLVLARWLRGRSRAQSRLEYRLYAEQWDRGQPLDLNEITPLVDSYDAAVEVAPRGKPGCAVLDQLSMRVVQRLPATAARIDAEILKRDPTAAPAILRGMDAEVQDVTSAPWCESNRGGCIAQAMTWVVRAELAAPLTCAPLAAHARLLYLGGDGDGAVAFLQQSVDIVSDRPLCEHRLAELARDTGHPGVWEQAVDALSRAPCGTEVLCTKNLLEAAALAEANGGARRAIVYLQEAHNLDPDNETIALHLAASESAAGLHEAASDVYRAVARRRPGDVRIEVLLEKEQLFMEDPKGSTVTHR